jgi:hypothetical protein
MAEFNQELVNSYIKNWVGISVYNTVDYNRGPSCFGLYFLDYNSATSSYEFIREWQKWNEYLPLILSIVKENEKEYSFYFYKQGRPEFIKGTFSNNLDVIELGNFLLNDKNRKFALLPRFPDDQNNIVDSYTTDVILIDGLIYNERSMIKLAQIENNI